MAGQKKYSAIFVEFDAIFDTRASLLFEMNEEVLMTNLAKDYQTRIIDKFDNVDYNDFQARYKARDKSLLKNALTTPIIPMIGEFVKSTMLNAINGPDIIEPKIIINTYPYKLVKEEIDVLHQVFMNLTQGFAPIEFVYMSNADITPRYVKDNISVMIMYDYTQWLELHCSNGNFKKVTVPDVSLLAPRLYFIDPGDNYFRDITNNKQDPFKVLEDSAAMFVKIKLLPIHMFSMAIMILDEETEKSP